jgi:transcriptional regulator with XRE-family HTH domain
MRPDELTGLRIKAARKVADLKRKQMGLALRVKTADAGFQIWRWESGSNSPRKPMLARIAKLLGVSEAWLVYGVGDAPPAVQQALAELIADRKKRPRRRAAA